MSQASFAVATAIKRVEVLWCARDLVTNELWLCELANQGGW